jgi:hypothetical protein
LGPIVPGLVKLEEIEEEEALEHKREPQDSTGGFVVKREND